MNVGYFFTRMTMKSETGKIKTGARLVACDPTANDATLDGLWF